MSTLPPLSSIRPTPSIPFYFSFSIWVMPTMSSSPSASLPNASTPNPSIMMPTFGSSSSQGMSFGFNMGSGIPSTSTIPMRDSVSYGTSSHFRWNMSSGFGPFPSQIGVVIHLEVLTFLGLAHLSLGVIFHHGEVFLLCPHLGLGVSSLRLTLGIFFLECPHLPSG
jgi:hypothetical protein